MFHYPDKHSTWLMKCFGLNACRAVLIVIALIFVVSATSCMPAAPSESAAPPGKSIPEPGRQPVANAVQPALLNGWDIVSENFDSGPLTQWDKISPDDQNLVAGGGHNGSTGLAIVGNQQESFIRQTRVTAAKEGYLSFWFNPNDFAIQNTGESSIPAQSIRIANVKGSKNWHALVGLRIRQTAAKSYKAYLEWRADDGTHFDYRRGEFSLVNSWQKITLGYRVDDWVAVWLNDVLVRQVKGITHDEDFGEIIELGDTTDDYKIAFTGSLRYDDIVYQLPRVSDLWVDAVHGSDSNDGLSQGKAFRTIQKAASRAGPGTKVHILPGIYREAVSPVLNGTAAAPIVYAAEAGPGTAVLRGSISSQALTWTPLATNTIGLPASVDPTKIYYTDLSAWSLSDSPRFVAELDNKGSVTARLPLARAPNWSVTTEWKYHEFWWAADGGSTVAGCDPATDSNVNCDYASRSMTQLTDRTTDAGPTGIQPGNLTTLGDLTGATLVAIDTRQGHYVYRRTIVNHNLAAGLITVDAPCEHDPGSGDPGLGWGTKYYVEGKASLLNTPGEWWYDKVSRRLYLWPRATGSPSTMNIEISRQSVGFTLTNRSYINLDGLRLELFNDSGIADLNDAGMRSWNNAVRNATILYANHGIDMHQTVDNVPDNITSGFTLEHSEIGYMDTDALHLAYYWQNNSAPSSFTHAGITNTVIKDNTLHHLSFRSSRESAAGILVEHPDKLRFEGNHMHHTAHNGLQLGPSVVQSTRQYGFTPDEIKTGEILIKDNIFEQACQVTTDCGALKFWGDPPAGHVFRDVLITGNVFRDTFGWTYVSEKRKGWSGGPGSDVRGMGGFGLYLDMVSGIHAYRNIAYNDAFAGLMVGGVWRDGDIVLYNNVVANTLYGFFFTGFGTHPSINTQVVNNIMVGNEGFGLWYSDTNGPSTDAIVDHNLYYNNGWRSEQNGGFWEPGDLIVRLSSDNYLHYMTLADIQSKTPWESHGVEGNPLFLDYKPDDHDLFDLSRPDFHITAACTNALNLGTANLPDSLTRLLQKFGVPDQQLGGAFDIGRYEAAGALSIPPSQSVEPGQSAQYTLLLYPFDFPYPVSLSVSSVPPDLTLNLGSSLLAPGTAVTLTVTDQHASGTPLVPGIKYRITLAATYAGATQNTEVYLLVGGTRQFLPLIRKSNL